MASDFVRGVLDAELEMLYEKRDEAKMNAGEHNREAQEWESHARGYEQKIVEVKDAIRKLA